MDRIPPQSNELEQAVLGGMLLHKNEDFAEMMQSDYFYTPLNRSIFEIIKNLSQSGTVDMIKVENALINNKNNIQFDTGYIAYLITCASGIESTYEYIAILRDYAQRRNLIHTAHELITKAYETEADECIDFVSQKIYGIEGDSVADKTKRADQIYDEQQGKEQEHGFRTGVYEIDEILFKNSGLVPGHTSVLLADSSHGKTQVGMFIAAALARRGYVIHWFQLEDSEYKTAKTFKAMIPDHYQNIFITSDMFDVDDIRREVKLFKKSMGTTAIFVDYVQSCQAKNSKNRNEQVEYISRTLTHMAKTLNICSVLMSQVSIDYSKRRGWALEPRYSDVRWSQQLKQDAHKMISIFRPNVVPELIEGDMVKDSNDKTIAYNSVFAKCIKDRGGALVHTRAHLIQTDNGIAPYEKFRQETEDRNNAWIHKPASGIYEPVGLEIDDALPF